MALDSLDRKILQTLQGQADCTMVELGERVGLSHTPCWRRVKRLEGTGVIKERVTLLDPDSIDLGVTVYVYINVESHQEESLNDFEKAVTELENVVECYSTSGDRDYVLRVVVESVGHYEKLLKSALVHLPNVASVNSTFALKRIKYTTQLPIGKG
ncbi:MAG: Lrp/AsnC family transcriptional regulator [Halioglobus sp.]